jgi:hypothetical protein
MFTEYRRQKFLFTILQNEHYKTKLEKLPNPSLVWYKFLMKYLTNFTLARS